MNDQRKKRIASMASDLWNNNSVTIAFLILIALCGIIAPTFFTWNNFMTIFRNCSAVSIIAFGMTFVIITGGIDLSAGAVFATCGVVLLLLQGKLQLPLIICIVGTCIFGMLVGAVNGIIIAKAKLPPFIVTLATQVLLRSIIKYATNGATIRGVKDPVFSFIGNGNIIGNFPAPYFIVLLIALGMHILLAKTKFGTYVYAIGGNETTAKYTGIRVDAVKIATYTLMGLMCALASVVEVSRMASMSPTISGMDYELEAVTAAIIGGTAMTGGRGKIGGTIIGGIILFIITNIMIHMNISTYLSGTVKGLVILAAVLIQKRDN